MSGIYFASKAKHGKRWQQIRATGVPVVSTWIDECGDGETSDWADLWSRSIAEASTAMAVIVYNEPHERMKGALVEIGAALANGRPVYWVGETRDPEGKEYTVVRHPMVCLCDTIEQAIHIANETRCANH